MEIKKEYTFKESENKWQKFWETEKIYSFDNKSKKPVFSVDTPPPTLSGKMHLGHSFSYSQQDFIVRYHRMKQENVFYPFGTDDNGLPTERLVEKLNNVKSTKMKRPDFVELCNKTVEELKFNFIQDWKNIGMSCDFSETYSTIDKHSIKTAQKSFIDLYNKNLVFTHLAPSIWCVNCQTTIAQAELEDKELDSTFNSVVFNVGGDEIIISTTRPELLGACTCVYVNPNDNRYKKLIGRKVIVPLFNYEVTIFSDESADPNKGSGAMMICSYGDKYDVEAIKKRNLEPRVIFTKDGKINELGGKYCGLQIKESRKQILIDLEKQGLLKDKKNIKHIVNVHDKCGTEVEFLSSKQWFVKILPYKSDLIKMGRKIKWHPEFMRLRYEHWITGLQWDWGISRQRHFGVPFPVWYCKKCNNLILADEKQLPVDPLKDKPVKKCKCGTTDFVAEEDVFDTWFTSSLTPEILLNWVNDKGWKTNFQKMSPMSLRPNAHDIIRTWDFYTIVKSMHHHNNVPWKNVIISGHTLDPKGESMHKSKGNTIEPNEVLDKYGADALRFWAASSKLGEDLQYLEKDLVTGQKTVNKLWNASKFVLMNLEDYKNEGVKLEIIDKWLLIKLNKIVEICTVNFDEYEYSKARSEIDNFFWNTYCDYYLEIVKNRLYNEKGKKRQSAQFTLYNSLLIIIKLFAPIMPHITEEIYSIHYEKDEKYKSVHISKWPDFDKTLKDNHIEKIGELFMKIVQEVRKFKTINKKSLKEEIRITLPKKDYGNLGEVIMDLKAVTNAKEIKIGKNFGLSF
ncbi:MAG TPA: valine--tRNA ligase [Candidatus Nanoarchaeia archaeon]|nr:valine--tRNA ligase [Candidatus Nanoarchaeia archaeon]